MGRKGLIRNKLLPTSCLACLLFALMITANVSCRHQTVVIASPYERYDHNRTKKISVEKNSSKTIWILLKDEDYTLLGSENFSKARHNEECVPADNLPVANIVPIFTGVPLPLSSETLPGVQSDRSDLIDFLAAGPYAQAGVERGDVVGDLKDVEIKYKPVLDFLGSVKHLSQNREAIFENLSHLKIKKALEVRDARYRLRFFADVLAFGYEKFWFVLYKLPGKDSYSRLVVVPRKD